MTRRIAVPLLGMALLIGGLVPEFFGSSADPRLSAGLRIGGVGLGLVFSCLCVAVAAAALCFALGVLP